MTWPTLVQDTIQVAVARLRSTSTCGNMWQRRSLRLRVVLAGFALVQRFPGWKPESRDASASAGSAPTTPPGDEKGKKGCGKGKKGKGKGKEKRRDGPYDSALVPAPPSHPPSVMAPPGDDVVVSRTATLLHTTTLQALQQRSSANVCVAPLAVSRQDLGEAGRLCATEWLVQELHPSRVGLCGSR